MNPSVIEDRNNTMPVLQSFCCQPVINKSINVFESLGIDGISYDACIIIIISCCLISSILGICGSTYQLYPKRIKCRLSRHQLDALLRQNFIICRLALADFLVSIGLFVRSAVFLGLVVSDKYPQPNGTSAARFFCVITVVWIEYFYLCTFLWTFCFAYEIYRILKCLPSLKIHYQVICWGLSACIFISGFIPIVVPSGLSCEKDCKKLLPHYLLSEYLPLLFVMIGNPVLYRISLHIMLEQLKMKRGRFTDEERKEFNRLFRRFFRITGVFWICWFPNLLLGPVMLIASFHRSVYPLIIILQILKAVMNPLQALFNTFAYTNYIGWQCKKNKAQMNNLDSSVNGLESSMNDHDAAQLQSALNNGNYNFFRETDPLLPNTPR